MVVVRSRDNRFRERLQGRNDLLERTDVAGRSDFKTMLSEREYVPGQFAFVFWCDPQYGSVRLDGLAQETAQREGQSRKSRGIGSQRYDDLTR